MRDAKEGFPVLRLTCLKNGRVDLSERKIGAWTKDEAAAQAVAKGDFFVSRGNGSLSLVGRGGLVVDEPDGIAYPDTLIRLRSDSAAVEARYLQLIWDTQLIRRQVESSARTTAGIYKINQRHIEAFVVPLPPLEEQRRIVTEADRLFSMMADAAAVIDRSLKRAERLRQSTLKLAFEGRLVPQDPHDEPASVLLERIRVERAAAGAAAGGKRRSGLGRQRVMKAAAQMRLEEARQR